MYLRINSPNVVREFFDGEVVVVNLESGSYYSLENVASRIWLLFEQGLTVNDVLTLLAEKYKMESAHLRPSLEKFVESLVAEKLVIAESQPIGTPNNQSIAEILANAIGIFSEPILRKYNDMQDLLLLDPIHDVDDTGWPATKQGNER